MLVESQEREVGQVPSYLLVNAAYFAVLGVDEILESSAVAVTFVHNTLGPIAAAVIPFFVALSCIGTLNGTLFSFSRMFFSGARDGRLPELLAMINVNYVTPMPSVIFLGILSLSMLCVSDVYVLINYLAFADALVVALAVGGLLKMRFRDPNMKRPIKFNIMIPITFFVITMYILLVPFMMNPSELLIDTAVTGLGVPLYFIFVYYENKPRALYRIWSKCFG
ncbi:amino acid permease domain-containing protein [Ditylenchus destructor]|uniref:Amino acid permease domain-containing protein n=1 Tax=Ditylenchus destructor TaxID=166010 RepID=A0AAD4MTE1_9BILA|nr:amino acid permease domain-containing protein [Ditylenchus destructor]